MYVVCVLARLAAMLFWGTIRGYRPVTAGNQTDAAAWTVDPAERAVVVRAVAVLDQRYQEGDLSEDEYHAQRLELMARVLDPDTSQHGEIPGEQRE